jgi:outer membrane autotransporter protein
MQFSRNLTKLVLLIALSVVSLDSMAAVITAAVGAPVDGAEGETPENGSFVIAIDNEPSSFMFVLYNVSGTANSGSDFVPFSGMATFFAGDGLSQVLDLAVLNDYEVEGPESVTITITNVNCGGDCSDTGAIDGAYASTTMYIEDDDVDLDVYVDLNPNDSLESVQVGLFCSNGSIHSTNPQSVTEPGPASFIVQLDDWASPGTACNATATSSNYDFDVSDCTGPVPPGGGSCTVYGTLPSVTEDFTVYKDFLDDNGASVNVTLTCPGASIEDNTLPAAQGSPAVFSVTWNGSGAAPSCTASETVPPGYTADETDCLNVPAFGELPGSCTIVNTPEPVTEEFTVFKDFLDDSDLPVDVTLTCPGATVDGDTLPAAEGSPAVFSVTWDGYGPEPVCTATEIVPPGYTADETDCSNVPAFGESPGSCTIVNTPDPVTETFTVFKDFSDDSDMSVDVTLTCPGATVDDNTLSAAEGSPAVFSVTWDSIGAAPLCSATESVPPGYFANEEDCTDVAAFGGAPGSCTITNTAAETRVVVEKVYTDDNDTEVQVTLSCTNATIENSVLLADPQAVFVLRAVGPGNQCTAAEVSVPEGYEADASECEDMAVAAGPATFCKIYNSPTGVTPGSATLTVNKVFSDESAAEVQISLECTAATPDSATKPASMGQPAVFSLSNVGSGNVCTATEAAVPGYEADESACESVAVADGAEAGCTITNTLTETPGTASFTVNKVFSDDSAAEVRISLSCTAATADSATKPASMGQPAVFSLSNVGSGNVCTATEAAVPGYEADESDCESVAAADGAEAVCTITNTLSETPGTASFTVNKVFSDGNTDDVQISLSCTAATPDSATKPASMGNPAVFSLNNVGSGNVCTATEAAVPGYDGDASDCAAVAVAAGAEAVCTVTNTLTDTPATASFTVNKVFSDESAAEVQISLSCTAAIPDSATKTASMGNPAVFSLSEVGSENVCTATEAAVPGYQADASACASVAAPPGSSAGCQIVNQKNPGVTFTVNKFFSDGNPVEVQIGLTCTGADPDSATKTASMESPAVFQLSNVVAGATCTATERTNVAGYVKGETQCADVPVGPNSSGECTITNIERISNPDSNEGSVGDTVLNTCPTGQNAGGFQEVCNGLVSAFLNGVPVDQAMAQITPDDVATVRTTGMQTTSIQVSAVDGRIGTLRGGGGAGFSASGFSASFGEFAMSGSLLRSFISAFDQNSPDILMANAGQTDDTGVLDEFGRWGAWISGRVIFGKKDYTTNQIDYDFDTAGLTFGLDYRFNDEFVAGVAVGYANTSADIGRSDGDLDTKGYSVSLYGTYFHSDRFYLAGSLGYGGNRYDQRRNVKYDLGPANSANATFNVDQTMAADYDGTQFSVAINGGWDFNRNGWTFGPTIGVSYADVSVDGYDERLIRTNVSGYTLGWAVHIDDQTYESLQPSIGFEFSKAVSASWGVFIPQGYVNVISELKDGSRTITGRFLGDTSPEITGLPNDFALQTDDFEETFARAGLGFGLVLRNNKSAFLMVDGDLGRDLLQTWYINAGFRWQF